MNPHPDSLSIHHRAGGIIARRRTRLIRASIARIFTLAWGCIARDASHTWRKKKDPSTGNNPRIEPPSSFVSNLAKEKCERCYVAEKWEKTDDKEREKKNE